MTCLLLVNLEPMERGLESGDVVDVRGPLKPWGKKEGPPRFLRVRINGARPRHFRYLTDPINIKGEKKLRAYKLDVNTLLRLHEDQLKSSGGCGCYSGWETVEIDVKTFKTLVREKYQ